MTLMSAILGRGSWGIIWVQMGGILFRGLAG